MLEFLSHHKKLIFGIAIAAGILLRLLVAFDGYNFDVESYRIVADIMDQGGNVYTETVRYNYGPVWFGILHVLDSFRHLLPASPTVGLRFPVTIFLTVVDIGITWILLRKFGKRVALLFFLNPISIIITGYHSQFDNLAILFGLLAVWSFGNDYTQLTRRKFGALLLLGLSLMTKHVLFIFPLWLAFKQRGWWRKLVVLAIPLAIFLISFAPFWATGSQGIIDHVFLYRSQPNAPFWYSLMPGIISNNIPLFALFIVALIITGLAARRYTTFKSLLIYLGCLVVFSSSVVNQYLAIPVAMIAVYPNWLFYIYTMLGTVYLLINEAGLGIEAIGKLVPDRLVSFNILVSILAFGMIWMSWKKQLVKTGSSLIKWAKEEARYQLSR